MLLFFVLVFQDQRDYVSGNRLSSTTTDFVVVGNDHLRNCFSAVLIVQWSPGTMYLVHAFYRHC